MTRGAALKENFANGHEQLSDSIAYKYGFSVSMMLYNCNFWHVSLATKNYKHNEKLNNIILALSASAV
jgi:hypothetical protein